VRAPLHRVDAARVPARGAKGAGGVGDGGRKHALRRLRSHLAAAGRPRPRRDLDLRLYPGVERVHHRIRVPAHSGEADADGLAGRLHDPARHRLGSADGRGDALLAACDRLLPAGAAKDRVRTDGGGGEGVVAEIQFVHVNKVYGGETPAVRDLNLKVEEGEFVVLVGPSGCGKTTALRMVAGLEEITDGEIRIGESVVKELAHRERDIAMVFQNYALYPHKTVYENLAFGLRMRKIPKPEQRRRVEEIARILGLEEMLQRRPAQ